MVGCCVVWVQFDSLSIALDSFLLALSCVKYSPQVVISLRLSGVDLDGLAKVDSSFLEMVSGFQGTSEIVVGLPIVGIELGHLFKAVNRLKYQINFQ